MYAAVAYALQGGVRQFDESRVGRSDCVNGSTGTNATEICHTSQDSVGP